MQTQNFLSMYQFIVKLRSDILVFLTHNMALPLLQLLRNEEKFGYTLYQLKSMPEDSLGFSLGQFLQRRNLELLPYYARHDIKHVLLNYDTTDEGEVCLQCFMLGNGHLSIPVVATVLYGFFTMPEYWVSFKLAFRRGKQSIPIDKWQWFELLFQPLEELQEKINNNGSIKFYKR
jgi:ubiquinone biosynthesis protein Coq4